MANKEVTIKVTATDAASPTFKKISNEAKSMGAQVDASAKQSSRSLDEMSRKGAAVGAGIGALVGGVSVAGAAFASQEQQIRGLTRAYGESTPELLRFAEQMQKTTVYSNDAARGALLNASTITRQYGIAADQIDDLVSRSADLAAIYGFGLTEATSRVTSAIRGEAEAAEALGIAMSDSALQMEAARRGLTGWNTTMTEAEKAQVRYLVLMEQTAFANGAAAETAETNAGKAKQFVNSLQDQVQGLGEASGAAGEYLSVLGNLSLALPLITGTLGKLAAGLGALGGGTALAGVATLAAASYYAYSLNQKGSGAESATAGFLGWAAGSLGFESVADQFNGIVKGNDLSKATNSLFYVPKGTTDNRSPEEAAIMNLKNAGVLPWNFSGSIDEAAEYISGQSGAVGMTNAQYIDRKAQSSGSFTLDPVTGQYVYNDTYTTLSRERALTALPSVGYDPRQGYGSMFAISQGQANLPPTFNRDYTGSYFKADKTQFTMARAQAGFNADTNAAQQPVTDAANVQVGMASMGAQSVAIAENATKALEAQYGAWIAVAGGITSTSEALSVFNAAQNELTGEMNVYQAQASEWTGQLNAQEAAYKILEERQANGIDLTKEQTDFMNNYAHAVEVGTGAVEDATLAAGINAQNLLLNKESADSFKSSTDSLAESIDAFIIALGGIPEQIETEIRLNRAGADIDAYLAELALIPPSVTTVLNTVTGGGVTVPGGTYTPGNTPYGLDGLTMNAYAGGGTVYGGNHALVGERGPEVVWLPNGSQVMNTEGSKSRMQQGRRGGGDIVNYGPINLQPASTDVYGALSSQLMGGVR